MLLKLTLSLVFMHLILRVFNTVHQGCLTLLPKGVKHP